jgi:excisionase family DNA binding protein
MGDPRENTVLLTVAEFAERASISRSMGYKLAKTGVIPIVRFGSAIRIPESVLARWIEANSHGGSKGESQAFRDGTGQQGI